MFPSEIWRKSRERIVSRCRPRFLIICHPRRNRGTHRQTRLITAFIFVPRLATIRDPSRRFRFDLVEDYHSSRGPPPCIETICKTRENARRTKPWKECRGVEEEEEEEVNLSTGGFSPRDFARGSLAFWKYFRVIRIVDTRSPVFSFYFRSGSTDPSSLVTSVEMRERNRPDSEYFFRSTLNSCNVGTTPLFLAAAPLLEF